MRKLGSLAPGFAGVISHTAVQARIAPVQFAGACRGPIPDLIRTGSRKALSDKCFRRHLDAWQGFSAPPNQVRGLRLRLPAISAVTAIRGALID